MTKRELRTIETVLRSETAIVDPSDVAALMLSIHSAVGSDPSLRLLGEAERNNEPQP